MNEWIIHSIWGFKNYRCLIFHIFKIQRDKHTDKQTDPWTDMQWQIKRCHSMQWVAFVKFSSYHVHASVPYVNQKDNPDAWFKPDASQCSLSRVESHNESPITFGLPLPECSSDWFLIHRVVKRSHESRGRGPSQVHTLPFRFHLQSILTAKRW